MKYFWSMFNHFLRICFVWKYCQRFFVQLQWISEKNNWLFVGEKDNMPANQWLNRTCTQNTGLFLNWQPFIPARKRICYRRTSFTKPISEKAPVYHLSERVQCWENCKFHLKCYLNMLGVKKSITIWKGEKALSNKSEKKERMIKNREMWKCGHSKKTFETRLEI